jgi:methionyl-tRNA synthetase
MRNTIHVSLQICASLSVLMEPVLPFTAAKIRAMLNLAGIRSSEAGVSRDGVGWDEAGKPLMRAGQTLGDAEILFNKIEDTVIEEQTAKLQSGALPPSPGEQPEPGKPFEPAKPHIEYDDFAKLDLRAGVVLEAERVPKSDKLLRLQIDLGYECRQVLAGAAQHFSAEEMVGRRVVIVANLKPRKMMGLESQGMVLMAEDRDGTQSIRCSRGVSFQGT